MLSPEIPVRVGLYTRVSTDMQAFRDEGSLDTQEARLRAAVASRAGFHEVRRVYREEGQSGKSLDRPEMQRMITEVKAGELDLIMVTRLDRLSRSLLDFYALHSTFQGHGVSFTSLNEAFDTSSPMGRAMLKLVLVFAELEREQTAERTRQAMHARAERGLWNGGHPPLGYDSAGNGHLTINPEEAALVRLMFEKYPELRSVVKLTEWLEAQGYRTRRYTSRRKGAQQGGTPFTYAIVRQALRNPLYIGQVRCRGEVFPGQHPPIVEEALWQRVQGIIDGNAKNRRGPSPKALHDYLLTGLLRCSCGYAMTTSAGTGRSRLYFYYRCVGIQKSSEHVCTLKQLRAEMVEEQVVALVRRAAHEPLLLEEAVRAAEALLFKQTAPLREQLAGLKREQARVEEEVRLLFESILASGLSTSAMAREKLGALEVRREQLRLAVTQAEEALASAEADPLDLPPLRAAVHGFDAAFDGLSSAEKREFLGLMIHRITVHPDRLEVDLYDGRQAVAWLHAVRGGGGPVRGGGGRGEQAPEAERPRTDASRFVADQDWLPLLDLNQRHPD